MKKEPILKSTLSQLHNYLPLSESRSSMTAQNSFHLHSNTTLESKNNNANQNIPRHVAIIMDGNGRWAANKDLPTIAGHRAGADTVRKIMHLAVERGIRYLTLYTFSTENWTRPKKWIEDLFGLLRHYLKNEISELKKSGVKLKVIGDVARLPQDIVNLIQQSEQETVENTKLTLILAISYGARDEMVHAVQRIAQKITNGELEVNEINADLISENLYTSEIPDPDLLIRTSGEKRLSNYLLWQLAYTEFVFSNACWPDFGDLEFNLALEEFSKRKRRYGDFTTYQPTIS